MDPTRRNHITDRPLAREQGLALIDISLDELARGVGQRLAGFFDALEHLPSDILGDISRPALARIEGDDAYRIVELARHEIVDDGAETSILLIGFAIRTTRFAEVIKYDVHGDIALRH